MCQNFRASREKRKRFSGLDDEIAFKSFPKFFYNTTVQIHCNFINIKGRAVPSDIRNSNSHKISDRTDVGPPDGIFCHEKLNTQIENSKQIDGVYKHLFRGVV